jgi:hypothetical protein
VSSSVGTDNEDDAGYIDRILSVGPQRVIEMTELDKALAAAQQDRGKTDAFYSLFLNTDVLIPTRDVAAHGGGSRRSQEGESFIPIVVENEGVPFLPIFDRMERLQAWAQGQEVSYVQMVAHALIRSSLDPKLHFALNVGTSYFKEFDPDELAWLRQSLEEKNPSAFTVPGGTKVFVGAPANIPDGLEDALRSCMRRNTEVQAAFLGQIHFDLPREKPQLFLVLKTEAAGQQILQSINEDIGVSIRGLLGEQESLTMQIYDGKGVSSEIVGTVEPFYVRDQ